MLKLIENKQFRFAEPVLFFLVLVLHVWPIINIPFFPVLDGPAHVYNAKLINDILFHGGSFSSSFFVLQSEPLPNWAGHVILLLLQQFFSPILAQKILLLLLIVLLPITFRNLLKISKPGHYFFSYLIFPFTYSFVFFLGFYNFLLAIIFFFITIRYFLLHRNQIIDLKRVFVYAGLFALTYFSHLFVFGLLLLCLFVVEMFSVIKETTSRHEIELVLRVRLKEGFKLIIIALPFLLLMMNYFSKRPGLGEPIYLSKTELTDWLKNFRPIIALHFEMEEVYTKKLVYLIYTLFVVVIYEVFRPVKMNIFMPAKAISSFLKAIKQQDAWLMIAAIFLLLYFWLPDSDGNAGYVSLRMGLLFFLFIVLWIAARPLGKFAGVLTMFISVYCSVSLMRFYQKEAVVKSDKIEEIVMASSFIKEGSIVLPLNFEDDWLLGHSSNWMGVSKDVLVLENYEATVDYFPLKWNRSSMPSFFLGTTPITQFACISCVNNEQGSKKEIDYIFKQGLKRNKEDVCENSFFDSLDSQYRKVYEGVYSSLWVRKTMVN